ncbi:MULTISPECIES: response regulator transcription factor [unclassified Flavobacterium]|uniref:response regulator transcription factor n=1 Tax=unclassified Flavobacterium TaxID=196869 RepID=UPI003623EC3A
MKIVIIEDEDMLRRSLAFFLRSKEFDVEEFDNGLDAIDYIKNNSTDIDIIITDLNLPFAGGKQVIHACKQIPESAIPIIVLTSSGVENTELEVFDLGADEFIAKPFSPQVLLKRIEKLISS